MIKKKNRKGLINSIKSIIIKLSDENNFHVLNSDRTMTFTQYDLL